MIYGYARVSTTGQSREGNSLEAQIETLQSYNCDEIVEEAYTGKTTHRPEFSKLLEKLQEGDTLIVTKLDRFARTLLEGEKVVRELLDRGVVIHIHNMSMRLDNTPGSKMMRQIFFSFAEYERDMIIERTQSGKAIAKQRDDFKEGRPPKYTKKKITHALELLESRTYKQVEDITGISKSTLIRAKRKNLADKSEI